MVQRRISILEIVIFLLPLMWTLSGCKKQTVNADSDSGVRYLQSGEELKLRCVEKTADGGFIYTGIQAEDAFLMKVDANGAQQWYKTYGGSHSDEFYSVINTKDGGFLAVGFSNSFGTDYSLGAVSGYAVKTNNNGGVIWEKTYKHINYDLSFRAAAENPAGGFAITGLAYAGLTRLNLFLIDANGSMLLSRIFTDYSGIPPLNIAKSYMAFGLAALYPGGDKIILGSIMSKSNLVSEVATMMPTLIETKGNGIPVALYRDDNEVPGNWYYQNVMQEKRRNIGLKILPVKNGYLYATSFEYPGNDDPIVIQITRTNVTGDLSQPVWKKEFKGLKNALFLNMTDNGDGTFLICGSSTAGPFNFSYTELFDGLKSMVMKIDGDGNVIWTRYFGSDKNVNMALAAQTMPDGSISVAGLTSLNTSINNKLYWMKLDRDGNLLN